MTNSNKIEIKEVQANGMTFRVRTAGLGNGGEPIVFLHGFPESSVMWNELMLEFASRGYQCIAPDQRGYSKGARPKGKENYTVDKLASDVIAISDVFKFDKIHLIGHDWGASAGWTVVQIYPERINDWTALSVPHMAAYNFAKRNDPEQMEKSKYIGVFQTKVIPELLTGAFNLKYLRGLWKGHSPEAVKDYESIFGTYAGRTGTLNWYRGNKGMPFEFGDVVTPTLFIWGNDDLAIARAGVDGGKKYMKGEYTFVELNAGHWLMQEEYTKISEQVINHIQNHPIKG